MSPRAFGYTLHAVDHPIAENLRDEVVGFWLANRAIPFADEARRRADELVCIARDATGQIVGVNTAYRTPPGRDGRSWFAYRMFVRPQDRLVRLSLAMVREATAALQRRQVEPPVAGVVLVTENQKLMRRGGHRVLQWLGFTRVGSDRRGQDIWKFEFNRAD